MDLSNDRRTFFGFINDVLHGYDVCSEGVGREAADWSGKKLWSFRADPHNVKLTSNPEYAFVLYGDTFYVATHYDPVAAKMNAETQKAIYTAKEEDAQKKAMQQKLVQEEAAVQETTHKGLRYNAGKLRMDLLPIEWTVGLSKVLTAGAAKYAARNWEQGLSYTDTIGCARRHEAKYLSGEMYDDGPGGTGCHHLLLAAWNYLALVTFDIRGVGTNDLPKMAAEMIAKLEVPIDVSKMTAEEKSARGFELEPEEKIEIRLKNREARRAAREDMLRREEAEDAAEDRYIVPRFANTAYPSSLPPSFYVGNNNKKNYPLDPDAD